MRRCEETRKYGCRVLVRDGLERSSDAPPPEHQFLATGDPTPFGKVGRRFLGPEIGKVSGMVGQEKLCG